MASFVYGGVTVTLEEAGEAFANMDTIAKAIASKEGREYVALPRGVAVLAGGLLASETAMKNEDTAITEMLTTGPIFWEFMEQAIMGHNEMKNAKPLSYEGRDTRANDLSAWSGHIFPQGMHAANEGDKMEGGEITIAPETNDDETETMNALNRKVAELEARQALASGGGARRAAGCRCATCCRRLCRRSGTCPSNWGRRNRSCTRTRP